MIKAIENLPDVTFIDGITLDTIQAELTEFYQEKYKEITGRSLVLRPGEPESLKLYAVSVMLMQIYECVEKAGRMDLLKYSYGAFLDNLGANKGVLRLAEQPASTAVRFTLSAAQPSVVTIPQGTRVSNGDTLYFATDAVAEIPIGDLYVDIPCTCMTAGTDGNGLLPGALNNLVDLLPYVGTVANIDTTAGGAGVESDEDFAERIYLAPSGYSVAGPEDAYAYHTKSYSSAIGDVQVSSPSPCVVEVRFLMADGTLPSESVIADITERLSDKKIRPLTDKVTVLAPTEQSFDISLTYYINKSDSDKALTVQAEVAKAVDEYIAWQTATIGVDINPSVLIGKVIAAGAKRVEIASPAFTPIPDGTVARIGETSITYGGLEDD